MDRQAVRDTLRRSWAWLHAHHGLLWWVHSLWALAWGVAFMWLGTRRFGWLRLAFAYIGFIWISSLFLPVVLRSRHWTPRQRSTLQLLVNYFNKTFYQQLLFFVLPVYAMSATWRSPNVAFVALVAVSAVISTFDVVYDRHVALRPALTSVFFGFTLFACANVTLPIVWRISHDAAIQISGWLALAGFVTLRYGPSDLRRRRSYAAVAMVTLLLLFFARWGRLLVPPAPLRLVSTQFGTDLDRDRLSIVSPVQRLARSPGRLYALSAIYAPLGLSDRVRHRWTRADEELYRSPYYTVLGGRTGGFRLWTTVQVRNRTGGTPLVLWIETEGGQIIGRAELPAS